MIPGEEKDEEKAKKIEFTEDLDEDDEEEDNVEETETGLLDKLKDYKDEKL